MPRNQGCGSPTCVKGVRVHIMRSYTIVRITLLVPRDNDLFLACIPHVEVGTHAVDIGFSSALA